MRSAEWLETLGRFAPLAVAVVIAGCAAPAYVARGGLLWHPRHLVAVPDLSSAGWERVAIEDADLAFSKEGAGVIAVRTRCPPPDDDIPLRWEGRWLWLGVPRGEIERFHLDVDGYEAVSMAAESRGLYLRTTTVRGPACSLDVVLVAPTRSGAELVFESFMAQVRLRQESP